METKDNVDILIYPDFFFYCTGKFYSKRRILLISPSLRRGLHFNDPTKVIHQHTLRLGNPPVCFLEWA